MIKLKNYNRYGGIQIIRGKIATDHTLETPIYLSLFGGNIEAQTTSTRNPAGVENLDWFGNLYQQKQGFPLFNSSFEKILRNTVLISGNIKVFQKAIAEDLDWLVKRKIAKSISSAITITGRNSMTIEITVVKPDNTENKYQYLYGANQ